MKAVITLQGEKGEFQCSIVANGEKGSVIFYDKDAIIARQGKATISVGDVPETKAKVIETTERYDKDGNLVEKIVREIPEDEKAKPYIAPWVYGSTISPDQIARISNATQCAENAKAYANWASGCCDNAVVSVSNAKPSESHG